MAREESRKVYDYDREIVRGKLLGGFRKTGREATVADLAGLTGLPLPQIQAELPAVADEYGARLKVTESGEILYSFPDGLKSRYRGFVPAAKRVLKTLRKGAAEVAKFAFKAWIVVMLFGYFILFLALALFALVASVAMQAGGGSRDSRDSRRGGGGLGGLWLTTRLFDSLIRIWFYSELFKSPEQRYARSEARRERRPLHKAVFSHVFGDGDPNRDWSEVEKKAVVAFLQTHKGVITMPEFMAITGLDPVEAETAINRYLLEFEGTPEVSEAGAIYFSFPKLLARVGTTPEFLGSSVALKKLKKFSSNNAKADRTFRLVNIFNIAFGGYFLYNAIAVGSAIYARNPQGDLTLRNGFAFLYSASGYLFQLLGAANPIPGMLWGLGVVPLAFSALFFAVPILRSLKEKAENERIKFENLRRMVYRQIIGARGVFRPESVAVPVDEARPADSAATEKITARLAAWSQAEPESGGYKFDELARTQDEAERVRASIDTASFAPGKTVFDTQS